MAAPILHLFAMCKQVFGKYSADLLSKDTLSPIVSSLNKISKYDVGFSSTEFEKNERRKRCPAPVSYMELYRDNHFTMAVFIVKQGSSLPLHDHPRMFGLMKVIHGSVKLVSYSDPPSPHDVGSPSRSSSSSELIPMIRNEDKIISSEDECCVLTPCSGNIHQIFPVSEYAAFLDILYPSYGHSRPCHYFEEVNVPVSRRDDSDTTSKVCYLAQVPEPDTYWCDPLPYSGPRLD